MDKTTTDCFNKMKYYAGQEIDRIKMYSRKELDEMKNSDIINPTVKSKSVKEMALEESNERKKEQLEKRKLLLIVCISMAMLSFFITIMCTFVQIPFHIILTIIWAIITMIFIFVACTIVSEWRW